MVRPRRTSNLGADIRGDTSAPAMSTLAPTTPNVSVFLSAFSTIVEAVRERHLAHSAPTNQKRPVSRQRRKARTLFRRWIDMSFRHTWVNPLVALLLIVSAYLINPSTENPVHHALFLSYPQSLPEGADPLTTEIQYGKGKLDLVFVAFYTIFLSFTREFLMQRLLKPLSVYYGVKGRNKQHRFMEQAYTAIYFSIFGPFGLYVMSRSNLWYFNTTAMFEGFPHKTHDGIFKAYYLIQAAYWAQQAIVLVLMLEKPRKDFKELVGHHIITLALIALSYRFHFTYMGLSVYITHDISDFFLATSKTLNYIDSPIVAPYFALFACNWIYLRHYLNIKILYATLTEFATVGPFELNWATEQYKCRLSQVICFSLLAALQAVNLFWLYLILRIAKGYIFAAALQDERSEDEDSEHEQEPEREEDDTSKEVKVLLNGEATRIGNGTVPKPSGKENERPVVQELKKDR